LSGGKRLKRLSLLAIVFLPITICAQQTDLSRMAEKPGLAVSWLEDTAAGSGEALPSSLSKGEPVPSPTGTSTKARKTKKPPRPPVEGSMVGYVDDAIVGSQIRIRFDAGFHNNAPDRAEFFYAQYGGLNGPGPTSAVADLNFQQLYMRAEYAPRQRFSLFLEVPVRWIQPQLIVANESPTKSLTNEAGISDLAAGFKFAALATPNRYLTFQFQDYFPSGSASLGLGTGHHSVEPALLYYQKLSDRVTLEAELGDSHPIGGSSCQKPCDSTRTATGPSSQGFAGDVFFYGAGSSYVVYRGEHVRIAPVIEAVGWRVLGGLETTCVPSSLDCSTQEGVSADGTNVVNLKAGARAMLGDHNSFYIGYGHQLTHEFWYKEIIRAEYRYSF
jgi:hypothetical protein